MVVIAAALIGIVMVLTTAYLILTRRWKGGSHPRQEPAPDASVDTNPLMDSEPHSLRELCDLSQSGSGSGK